MFDLLLSSADESSPLYLRLFQGLKSLIEDGTVPDGTKLPSVRILQSQTQVSKFTVESAYQLLVAEGYAYSKPKSGFIAVRPKLARPPLPKQTRERAPIAEKAPMIDFNLLNVDRETFPALAWRSALADTVVRYRSTLHEYGDSRGESPLRHNLSRYLAVSRGVRCEPEQIVIGTGFSYSLFVLKQLWGSAGDIAFEEEGIAQVGSIFRSHGFRAVPWQTGQAQAAYLTPSHRPAGKPFTNDAKDRLLKWAETNGAFLLEDDYDGEFRYRGKPVPALQGADSQGSVIYMGTFSKSFTPALRMNYMVLPGKLADKLGSLSSVLSCPSRIDQLAMSLFMERGHWARHLKRIKKRYRVKRERLLACIEREWPNGEIGVSEGNGLQIELTLRTSLDGEALIRLASEAGVRVYGTEWGEAEKKVEYPRLYLGFGGITDEEMEYGVKLLKQAWTGALERLVND